MILRPERPGEEAEIHAMTNASFLTVSYGDGTEGQIIDRLRADGNLALSLVAVEDDQIVGQVTLSPATLGDMPVLGLGPICARIDRYREGIGSALMHGALGWAHAQGAQGIRGVVLAGSNLYYPRFGFRFDGGVSYLEIPRPHVHYLMFDGSDPTGEIVFAPGLQGA
ncbi:MAG: N-acetyltransferase [Pseudomonadota bacterium]